MGRKITNRRYGTLRWNKGPRGNASRTPGCPRYGPARRPSTFVIHSAVHRAFEWSNAGVGSVIAQDESPDDMRLPIRMPSFGIPERLRGSLPPLRHFGVGTLEFLPRTSNGSLPDVCLYTRSGRGGHGPSRSTAANEIAVEHFLQGNVSVFEDSARDAEAALNASDRDSQTPNDTFDVRAIDAWARAFSLKTIRLLPSRVRLGAPWN